MPVCALINESLWQLGRRRQLHLTTQPRSNNKIMLDIAWTPHNRQSLPIQIHMYIGVFVYVYVIYVIRVCFQIFVLICWAHVDATAGYVACTFDKTKDLGHKLYYYYFGILMEMGWMGCNVFVVRSVEVDEEEEAGDWLKYINI